MKQRTNFQKNKDHLVGFIAKDEERKVEEKNPFNCNFIVIRK